MNGLNDSGLGGYNAGMRHPGRDFKPITSQHLEAALDLWGQSRGERLIPVIGRSMLPTLRAGDTLTLAPEGSRVRCGDIVVYRSGAALISHRVLACLPQASGPVYLTKGDNQFSLDPPVASAEIIGVVCAVTRRGRSLDLDAPAWRRTNALIAALMRLEARLFYWGRRFGGGAGRIPARVLAHGFALALRLLQSNAARWRPNPPCNRSG